MINSGWADDETFDLVKHAILTRIRDEQARTLSTTATPTFGAVLRRLVSRTGLSQYRLGELAGVDHTVICRYLSGTRQPKRETLRRIARVLGHHEVSVPDQRRLYLSAGYAPPDLVRFLVDTADLDLAAVLDAFGDIQTIANATGETQP